MARSPVTSLLELYGALTEVERKVFLDLVDPQPEPEVPAKPTRKKRGPSKRAQSISSAITSSRAPKVEGKHDDSTELFEESGQKCGICGNAEEYQDHFQPSPNFHEFEAPKAKKAAGK